MAKEKKRRGVTDVHIHIQPWEMFRPEAAAKMKLKRPDIDLIIKCTKDAAVFLSHLDECGIDRAGVINYVSPDIIGFTAEVNDWVSNYCSAAPDRLLAVGSVHPRYTKDTAKEMDRLCNDLNIRMLKVHPPHQLIFPNDYRNGMKELEVVYKKAQAHRLPVMIHTGTSIFTGARNRYGQPIHCDDIGVDFPELTVILAHGGRPLWMEESFFLVRRHPNFYIDISGIPPKRLLTYFPRLSMIADKVLFGTDWPGPGVPEVKGNLEAFEALPLDEGVKQKILVDNAYKIFPKGSTTR